MACSIRGSALSRTEIPTSDDAGDAPATGATPHHDRASAAVAEGLTAKPLTPSLLAWRRFRRHKIAMISGVVLVLIALFVFVPGLLTNFDQNQRDTAGIRNDGPSWAHPLGTDDLRRDVLARVLYGGQVSLKVGIAVALISVVIGALIGAIAGFRGGLVDSAMMRVTDLFLAIPLLVILIVLTNLPARHEWAETLLGAKGTIRLIVTLLALFFWMQTARIVRGVVLSLKEKEFVEAARALGASDTRILMRHLLPNAIGPIVVNMTLSVAAAILTESTLSFLGYGVQSATQATWGNLLSAAKGQLALHSHLVLAPGIAVVLTVLCVNYLGDGLRDALDPKQQRTRA
jgi:peptide/nickel transport system permease protein